MTTGLKFLKAGNGGTFVDANKGDTIARIQYDDSAKHRYTLDLTKGQIQLKYASLDNSGNVTTGTEKTFTLPKFLLNKLNDTFAFKTDLGDYTKTTDLNTKLGDYTNTTDLNTKLSDYTKITDLNTKLGDYTRTDGSNITDDIQNRLMSHHTAQVFDFLSSLETEYNAMHG